MSKSGLPPDVRSFQQYINDNPELRKKMRKSGRSWQDFYDQWVADGKTNSKNPSLKDDSRTSNNKLTNHLGILEQVLQVTEKIDFDQVQEKAQKLDHTLTDVQRLLDQYKERKGFKESQTQQIDFRWFGD